MAKKPSSKKQEAVADTAQAETETAAAAFAAEIVAVTADAGDEAERARAYSEGA